MGSCTAGTFTCGGDMENCCTSGGGAYCTSPGLACVPRFGPDLCEACGGPGEPCCPGQACDGGGCCVDNDCVAPGASCGGTAGLCSAGSCAGGTCGRPGQPCCPGGIGCSAPYAVCVGGSVCETCGNSGDRCCSPDNHCNGSLVCTALAGPDLCMPRP
jgi:hypothetical protein